MRMVTLMMALLFAATCTAAAPRLEGRASAEDGLVEEPSGSGRARVAVVGDEDVYDPGRARAEEVDGHGDDADVPERAIELHGGHAVTGLRALTNAARGPTLARVS